MASGTPVRRGPVFGGWSWAAGVLLWSLAGLAADPVPAAGGGAAPQVVRPTPAGAPGTPDAGTLIRALRHGTPAQVAALLDQGATIEGERAAPERPLQVAAGLGRRDLVLLLLERGAAVDAKAPNDWTALMDAARNGHPQIVADLLERGAQIDARNRWGDTALLPAAAQGQRPVVGLLLERGAALESRDQAGRTALGLAVARGDRLLVRTLLAKGAEPESLGGDPWGALVLAAAQGHAAFTRAPGGAGTLGGLLIRALDQGDGDFAGWLRAAGADAKAADQDGRTALMVAAGRGDEAMVKALLRSGAVVEAADRRGRTALIAAAQAGHLPVVKALLAKGARVEAKDRRGDTAFIAAARADRRKVAAALRAKGADPDAGDGAALIGAVWRDDLRMLQWLLDQGADPNRATAGGRTVLMIAAERGRREMAAALLARHAAPQIRTPLGETALMIAAREGHPETVATLLAGGAAVEAKTELGETALIFAVRAGQREVAQALLARGADANAAEALPRPQVVHPRPTPAATGDPPPAADAAVPPARGRSALRIAVEDGEAALAQALLAHGAAIDERDSAGRQVWVTAPFGQGMTSRSVSVGTEARTVLATALARGDSAMALALLERGAGLGPELDPAWTAPELPTPLPGWPRPLSPAPPGDQATDQPEAPDPALPQVVRTLGWTALMAAATQCDPAVVEALLARGARIDATTSDGQTALSLAVAYGRPGAVRVLLDHGANVNARDAAGRTALSLAVVHGRTALVPVLIGQGAEVNAKDAAGRTPLWLAAVFGHTAALPLLLDHGAAVDARDAVGRTALWAAVASGQTAAVPVLLEHGADADAADAAGRTALWFALAGNRKQGSAVADPLALLQTLLDHGVAMNTPAGVALVCAAAAQGHTELVRVLLAKGADTDCRTRGDEPSSCDQRSDQAQYAWSTDACRAGPGGWTVFSSSDSCQAGAGWTALRAAAQFGHLAVVQVLLAAGADPEAKGADGTTALTAALARTHYRTARLLLEQGARIDPGAGGSALCDAAAADAALALALIEKGAEVNPGAGACRLPGHGSTPLMAAVTQGSPELVEALLAKGAAVEGRIAGEDQGSAGDPDGSQTKGPCGPPKGRTALMLAADYRSGGEAADALYLRIVEALLAHGAALDARDAAGNTALSIAMERDHRALVARLRQAGAAR